jgi:hypothetical protein
MLCQLTETQCWVGIGRKLKRKSKGEKKSKNAIRNAQNPLLATPGAEPDQSSLSMQLKILYAT